MSTPFPPGTIVKLTHPFLKLATNTSYKSRTYCIDKVYSQDYPLYYKVTLHSSGDVTDRIGREDYWYVDFTDSYGKVWPIFELVELLKEDTEIIL